MTLRYLVLFDIDGTLLWPDGSGRAAMAAALERVYGTPGPIDSYYFGGRTDLEAVRDLMGAAGIAPEAIEAGFKALTLALADGLRHHLASGLYQVRPCPGGLELVTALKERSDALIGLLTGNLRTTASLKLEAAGYVPSDFRVGAFGDESGVRSELFELAVQRASEMTGSTFPGHQTVVVGDTPSDVVCGQAYGARAVAVLTGHHTRAELEAHHASVVLDNLADTRAALEAILAAAAV